MVLKPLLDKFGWIRTRLVTILLLCITGATAGRTAHSDTASDNTFLDALQGKWVMTGTLGGTAVQYVADGQRVLQGSFLKLHMIDDHSPPQYEADVFIGFDTKSNDYIAHWLDRFGAAGARVVARGERHGQQLTLLFPYANGAFRDTFRRQNKDSWSLLLESQARDGSWSTFASYSLIRTMP